MKAVSRLHGSVQACRWSPSLLCTSRRAQKLPVYRHPSHERHFTSSRTRHDAKPNTAVGDNVLDTLDARGMLHQLTAPNSLRTHLSQDASTPKRTIYTGVDPSADSLHVGNLLPLFAALHFLRHGHKAVVLIGGATGMIGDPSGRDTERQALSVEQVAHNVSEITRQVREFFQSAGRYAALRGDETLNESVLASNVRFVNNAQFYEGMSILTFLRDVGKHARVSTMLARDSVKSRMADPTHGVNGSEGLSFTEFSYQLLQANDFRILHDQPWSCTIQVGGSDQMGNIQAGVDLIRRQKARTNRQEARKDSGEDSSSKADHPAYGVTLPLLTTSSGAKFGKSAGNAVWLDVRKCSHYDFYQYFFRAKDEEVETYLKALTLMATAEIEQTMEQHREAPSKRFAQITLADQVTELVRGTDALRQAQVAKGVLFDTSLTGLRTDEVVQAFEGDPRLRQLARSDAFSTDVAQLAILGGLAKSRGEARRAISNGGLYVNNVKVNEASDLLTEANLVPGTSDLIIMRLGGKQHAIFVLQGDGTQ